MTENVEITYVGDPMCSWCWGIAPTLHALGARDELSVRVVAGGLRTGAAAQPLDDRLRSLLAHHWEQVERVSGQSFDHSILGWEGWLYNTELPCTAIVVMRRRREADTLRFFTHIQESFYSGAIDITALESYPALLAGFDVDVDEFMMELASEKARARAYEDFAEARTMGVMSFPTLLLDAAGRKRVLARGYAPLDRIESTLDHWLEVDRSDTVSGLGCEDGVC